MVDLNTGVHIAENLHRINLGRIVEFVLETTTVRGVLEAVHIHHDVGEVDQVRAYGGTTKIVRAEPSTAVTLVIEHIGWVEVPPDTIVTVWHAGKPETVPTEQGEEAHYLTNDSAGDPRCACGFTPPPATGLVKGVKRVHKHMEQCGVVF